MHERLTKKTGLAVFASDALSSTAYASEEILLVLAVAAAYGQANAFNYVVPITMVIVVVLTIVAISYRQTIQAYPSGGGAYIVAKENLGTTPGLVAAAALLVDYILTVSVSIAAGVAAITSAAQGTSFAWLENHRVFLCLTLITLIALANLRGVRESGAIFAGPTYAFVISFLFMVGYGLLLPRASARERDGHLTVRAHNFYRPNGLVLLCNPRHHRADSDPGREHFFRRLSAIVQPAGARSVHAAAVCDPW